MSQCVRRMCVPGYAARRIVHVLSGAKVAKVTGPSTEAAFMAWNGMEISSLLNELWVGMDGARRRIT